MRDINMSRYLAVVHWAAMRWAISDMDRFKAVELMAARRYLGVA